MLILIKESKKQAERGQLYVPKFLYSYKNLEYYLSCYYLKKGLFKKYRNKFPNSNLWVKTHKNRLNLDIHL